MIKRLLLTLTAAMAVVGSPLATDLAQAREHGSEQGRGGGRGGGDRGGWDRGGGDRGGPRRDGPRSGGPRSDGPPRNDRGRGWEGRGGPPDWPRYGGPRERYEPPTYFREPRDEPRAPPRRPSIRPGGYLPPDYGGVVIEDYGRYRLRPPPRGYVWVRVGRDLALVSMDDGRIFDVAPF